MEPMPATEWNAEEQPPVSQTEALRALPEMTKRPGAGGFASPRFWIALVCHCASIPLFFANGVSWGSFQIVMPFLISFILVATLAWDFRLVGDPNKLPCLILHALLLVSLMFLLNRLMTMEDFVPVPPPEPGILSNLWSAGMELVGAVPFLDGILAIGAFLFKWLGYTVILFFVSGAVIFPPRAASSLLFVFGLIFIAISVGQNLNPSLWSLGLGLLCMTIAFVSQLEDGRSSRFWSRVEDALRRSPPAPAADMEMKIDLLRLLQKEKAVGEKQFRSVVAARLRTFADDPRVSPVCVRLAEQLATQDGLAESRDGSAGWRFVLSVQDEPADFFAFTARVVRVALTLGFSTLYILSPVDILPDATPVFGVVDDMLLGTVSLLSALRTIYAKSYS